MGRYGLLRQLQDDTSKPLLAEIGDCARMDIGVDAMGPRGVLDRSIADVEKRATPPAPVIASEQKPVVFYTCDDCGHHYFEEPVSQCDCLGDKRTFSRVEYFTSPPNTSDIEQRVAEACAKILDDELNKASYSDPVAACADYIRQGKWREFL